MLSDDQKNEIIAQLDVSFHKFNKAGHCPMCGHNKFTIADGYFTPILQKDLTSYKLGGASIPSIIIICTNCGFMSQHALGVLGLLPKKEDVASHPSEPSKEQVKKEGSAE